MLEAPFVAFEQIAHPQLPTQCLDIGQRSAAESRGRRTRNDPDIDPLRQRIDQVLGYPSYDPHGHAIPSPDGVMVEDDHTAFMNLGIPAALVIDLSYAWIDPRIKY